VNPRQLLEVRPPLVPVICLSMYLLPVTVRGRAILTTDMFIGQVISSWWTLSTCHVAVPPVSHLQYWKRRTTDWKRRQLGLHQIQQLAGPCQDPAMDLNEMRHLSQRTS